MYPKHNSIINVRNTQHIRAQVSESCENVGTPMFSVPPPCLAPGRKVIKTETLQQVQIIRTHNFIPPSLPPVLHVPLNQQGRPSLMVPPGLETMHPCFMCTNPNPHVHMEAQENVMHTTQITSQYELNVTSIVENAFTNQVASGFLNAGKISANEAAPALSAGLPSDSHNNLDRFCDIIQTALNGCVVAESLAFSHQKRPCFKKIDSLCARLRQDLVKPDNVMSNINSQGLAWAVKDFIFVFTRIMNAWIIVKGYVHNHPEGLTLIQRELCPKFLGAFELWHQATHELIKSLIASFINLNKLAKSQRGGSNYMKTEESSGHSYDGFKVCQVSVDTSEEPAESDGAPVYNGAYIRTGIYPNHRQLPRKPPGFEHKPRVDECKAENTLNTPKITEPSTNCGTSTNDQRSTIDCNAKSVTQSEELWHLNSYERKDMDQLLSKASTDCIAWVLDKVSKIEEAQYFYTVHFAKNYFPDFHLLAPRTCDLRTIYMKQDKGLYTMLSEVLDDLQKIVDVCKDYLNAPMQYDLWLTDTITSGLCSGNKTKELASHTTMRAFVLKMENLLQDTRNFESTIISK